jgi:hypothetical protein
MELDVVGQLPARAHGERHETLSPPGEGHPMSTWTKSERNDRNFCIRDDSVADSDGIERIEENPEVRMSSKNTTCDARMTSFRLGYTPSRTQTYFAAYV